jgi:uncharacterized protein
MIVGVMYVEMHLPGVTNLKAKRRVLQSIKSNVRNKFNVSISEVNFHDLWQRSALGVAGVGPDKVLIENEMNRILHLIENYSELEVSEHRIEFV